MNSDLESLIEGYLNETLSLEEGTRLDAMLRDSREARDEFNTRIRVHGALSDHYSDDIDMARFEPISLSSAAKKKPLRFRALLPAVAALIVASLVYLAASSNSSSPDPVARIVFSSSMESGPIQKGPFALEEGFAEIEMGKGARFAVEAGTEIDFISGERIRLIRGSLGADVPKKARGFTVVTPGGDVVDLGTRFGVSVDDSGTTQAELFQGEIEVHPKRTDGESFRGQAVVTLSETGTALQKLDDAVRPRGFPMPELVEIIPIARGNFEPGEAYEIGESTRDEIGVWGGNVARIVGQTEGISPFEGKGMLKLISTSPDSEASLLSFCDVLQWIDLRPYSFQKATISARMVVNRIPGDADTDTRFQLKVTPRKLAPSKLHPEDRREARHLQSQVSREADADPSTWEELHLTAELNADTRFIQLHIGASENRENNTSPEEIEFDGHFIDNVELQLLIPARPAIR